MDSVQGRRSRAQWEDVLYEMIDLGAKAKDQEFLDILDYLVAEHGRVNVNRGSAGELIAVLGLTADEAGAIVGYRRERGPYESFEALVATPGVDSEKLKEGREAISY